MKIGKLLVISAVSVCLLSSIPVWSIQAQAAKPIVLAYYTSNSFKALKAYHTSFNYISTDTFNTDSKGNIVGSVPTNAVIYAISNKIATYALISNYGTLDWDPEAAHSVFSNSSYRTKLINNMLNLVKKNKYKGINVDFESISPSDRVNYSKFVKDVAAKMKAAGYKTMVSVPAKTEEDPSNNWTAPYDYDSLGSSVDYVQVMTYDQNGAWSTPGSSAGKDWVDDCLTFSVAHIPARKVIMGIPAYGNDWNLDNSADNKWLNWRDTVELLGSTNHTSPLRDAASLSMHFTYTASDGSKHEVWYDDGYAVSQKAHDAITFGIAGVSMYALGQEDGNFWKAIQAGLKP